MSGKMSEISNRTDSTDDLNFLSKAVMEIANIDEEIDGWEYISQKLNHWQDAITLACSFEPWANEVEIRALGGDKTKLTIFSRQLGFDSIGMSIPVTAEQVKQFLTWKLVPVPGGLYETFSGVVTEAACARVERELGIGSVFAIGLGIRDQLYGSIFFLLPEGKEINNTGSVETFIQLASMALHAWKTGELENFYQQELIRANQWISLGMLIPGVIHDINNPNGVILLNSEIISQVWQDALPVLGQHYETHGDFLLGGVPYFKYKDKIGKFIADLSTRSYQINDIIVQLQNYSQPLRKDLPKEISINETVKSVLKLLSYRLKRCGRHIFQAYEEDLPRVCCNGQQLEQVMLYLLLDFTQSAGKSDEPVSLSTTMDDEGNSIVLEIEDRSLRLSGPELLKIKHTRSFPKNGPGHFGFGYFICKKIFEVNPGNIDVDWQPERGTIVTIRLPVKSTPAGEEEETIQ